MQKKVRLTFCAFFAILFRNNFYLCCFLLSENAVTLLVNTDETHPRLNDSRGTERELSNSLENSFVGPSNMARGPPASSSSGSIVEPESSSKDIANAKKKGRKCHI